jgi:hypothetical protein
LYRDYLNYKRPHAGPSPAPYGAHHKEQNLEPLFFRWDTVSVLAYMYNTKSLQSGETKELVDFFSNSKDIPGPTPWHLAALRKLLSATVNKKRFLPDLAELWAQIVV